MQTARGVKRMTVVCACFWAGVVLCAQECELKEYGRFQYNLNRRGLPHGNFSGISMIDDTTYLVVSDKDREEGFHVWDIRWKDGKPRRVKDRFVSAGGASRDAEGIVFHPSTKTVFVSAESDQRVIEYGLDGNPTGRELNVPEQFGTDRIQPNGGFESLSYNERTGLFWTCTELPLKGEKGVIRFQSFGEDLMPREMFSYPLDADDSSRAWKTYLHGISELCALDDGGLLVMERTVALKRYHWGSHCLTKIYYVLPVSGQGNLEKRLVASLRLPLNLRHWFGKSRFANYEGMCLAPSGRESERMLYLINDSQGGQKGLSEYMKVYSIMCNEKK